MAIKHLIAEKMTQLISRHSIHTLVSGLASKIDLTYCLTKSEKSLPPSVVVVCVLPRSLYFFTDVVRQLRLPHRILVLNSLKDITLYLPELLGQHVLLFDVVVRAPFEMDLCRRALLGVAASTQTCAFVLTDSTHNGGIDFLALDCSGGSSSPSLRGYGIRPPKVRDMFVTAKQEGLWLGSDAFPRQLKGGIGRHDCRIAVIPSGPISNITESAMHACLVKLATMINYHYRVVVCANNRVHKRAELSVVSTKSNYGFLHKLKEHILVPVHPGDSIESDHLVEGRHVVLFHDLSNDTFLETNKQKLLEKKALSVECCVLFNDGLGSTDIAFRGFNCLQEFTFTFNDWVHHINMQDIYY